ncbi:unnamed protein product [Rangifer tarandus platyrhynchus]|uniref:Uncharacterized protein n=1 Tax=Rangifer tarandus platyrhynchus TaxID=3082113 RepID=A0ABN8ZQT3_RANTA|nr:unnamed protein product [Rangifer tarandus platyrhynchus]
MKPGRREAKPQGGQDCRCYLLLPGHLAGPGHGGLLSAPELPCLRQLVASVQLNTPSSDLEHADLGEGAPFCESPPARGSSHAVALSSLSGGRKERLLRAVSLAWALPPRGPRPVPLAGPGSAACVPFPASRGPGEARGEDLKAHQTETHTTGTQDTSWSSGPSCKASTSPASPLTPEGPHRQAKPLETLKLFI